MWVEKIEVGATRGRSGANEVPQVIIEVAAKELNGVEPGRVLSDFRVKFEGDPAMAAVHRVGMLERKSQDSAKRVTYPVDLVEPK